VSTCHQLLWRCELKRKPSLPKAAVVAVLYICSLNAQLLSPLATASARLLLLTLARAAAALMPVVAAAVRGMKAQGVTKGALNWQAERNQPG